MLVKIHSASLNALTAQDVTLEIDKTKNQRREREPAIFMVGLPDNAVRESSTRVMSALSNSRFQPPQNQIIVNFAPADVRKEGTSYDLPLAVGLLAAEKMVDIHALEHTMLVGELGLDGSIRPVKGALSISILARAKGYETLIVPIDNVREAAVVNNLRVIGATHLKDVVDHLNGHGVLQPTEINTREEFYAAQSSYPLDMSDVKGQENVKRALEVAAAGGHNLMLIGSPGCGKSMMAKRLPGILPQLTLAESLETTQIHSIAGKLNRETSLITQRPFRSPHHTISDVALIGGGASLQPGEISLAHNGILFLDELPEFSRTALETMRQPLEDRQITISRAKYSATLPCSFMLVASMNPCPCGYYNHPTKQCTCTPGQIHRYMGKISGPLLDRIDIQVEVTPVPLQDLASAPRGENSAAIRERVVRARDLQTERFKNEKGIHCNAQMTARLIEKYARPDEQGAQLLAQAMKSLNLSARAYERILKVSRTIADLANSTVITATHIGEAVGYRNLDRASWGE
ncbi:MAG: YifB family Mg chelatase-like AAA ATPase [Bacteroidaceae bacterium]|nr:YifB family Mg chelatase-like AAA ATPase [Bacteroidaceae bacterium]